MTGKQGDVYTISDSTFRDDFTVSKEALDDEASGYFLVAAGPLPPGWTAVSREEGQMSGAKETSRIATMMTNVQKRDVLEWPTIPSTSSWPASSSEDTPIWYQAGYGPDMSFHIAYNQADAYQYQGTLKHYSGFGPQWTYDYVAFVNYNPSTPHWPASALVYEQGGGVKRYTFPHLCPAGSSRDQSSVGDGYQPPRIPRMAVR